MWSLHIFFMSEWSIWLHVTEHFNLLQFGLKKKFMKVWCGNKCSAFLPVLWTYTSAQMSHGASCLVWKLFCCDLSFLFWCNGAIIQIMPQQWACVESRNPNNKKVLIWGLLESANQSLISRQCSALTNPKLGITGNLPVFKYWDFFSG